MKGKTNKRRTERTGYFQREMLEEIFDSIRNALLVISLNKRNPPTIVECNQAAPDMFGYKKSEMLGRTTDFLHMNKRSQEDLRSQAYYSMEISRQRCHLVECNLQSPRSPPDTKMRHKF